MPGALRKKFILILSLSLNGCLLGPDFKEIETPELKDWRTDASVFLDGEKPWQEHCSEGANRFCPWRLFKDESLIELLQKVDSQNFLLKSFYQRVAQAAGRQEVASAELLPEFRLEPEFTRRGTSASARLTAGSFPRRTFDSFVFSSFASWELDLWGRVRRSVEAAQAELDAAGWQFLGQKVSLRAQTAATYFGLRALAAQVDILERSAHVREKSLQLTQAQFKAGTIDSLDVERAKAELASVRVSLQEQKRLQSQAQLSLAQVLSDVNFDDETLSVPLEAGAVRLPSFLPGDVILHRPDVRQALELARAANARIGVAKAAFFPAFSIRASGGFQSAEARTLFKNPSRIWSLAPGFSLPLFQGGRNSGNLTAAEAEFEARVQEYKAIVVRALIEVERALLNAVSFQSQVDEQKLVVEAAKRAQTLSQKRYEQGLVSYLELLDAQRTELQAETSYINLIGSFYGAVVDVIRAAGGSRDSMETFYDHETDKD